MTAQTTDDLVSTVCDIFDLPVSSKDRCMFQRKRDRKKSKREEGLKNGEEGRRNMEKTCIRMMNEESPLEAEARKKVEEE